MIRLGVTNCLLQAVCGPFFTADTSTGVINDTSIHSVRPSAEQKCNSHYSFPEDSEVVFVKCLDDVM